MGEIWLPDAVRLALAVGDIDAACGVTEASDPGSRR
jgi:hypothetical protein